MALYEKLTATSSPAEIAAAYKEFTGLVGGDTQEAQTRAVDYLTGLGISAPTITQAYSQFTQPAALSSSQIANTSGMGSQGIGVDTALPTAGALTQATSQAPTITFTPGLASQTMEQKAAEYNSLIGQGFTDAQIKAAADATFGTQSGADWSALTSLAGQGAAPEETADTGLKSTVITDYRGKEYDTSTLLNLANQLAGIADTSQFSGGVFGVQKGSVGFDYDQAARALGRDVNVAEQVLLDSARSLIDQGITDLSKLGMGDIKTSVNVQQEVDDNGMPTGNFVAYVPTGTDYEGNTTFTTRALTPEEAARIRTEEVTGTGDDSGSYTRRLLDDVVTGRGIVYDGKGKVEGSRLDAGATYTGKGGTSYQITYDEQGKPRFTTTGFSTSDMGLVAPLLQMASFIPGAQPFVLAANAAIAAKQGNVLGALASLAGAGNYTNLATGLNVANAVKNGDVGTLVGSLLSNPSVANMAGSTMLTDTISLADLGNAANVVTNIENKNLVGALNAAAPLTGSSDIQVAAAAATIVTELGKDNPNFGAIINASRSITNATNNASKNVDSNVVGGITNRIVDDLSAQGGGDLGSSTYISAINAGATEDEALEAANVVTGATTKAGSGVVINKIPDAGPSNVVTTSYLPPEEVKTERTRLAEDYATSLGKTIGTLTSQEIDDFVNKVDTAIAGKGSAVLKGASIQDIMSGNYAALPTDEKGFFYDERGVPRVEIVGGTKVDAEGNPITETTTTGSQIATNVADAIVESVGGLEGTTGKIVQQGLSTLLGGIGEQVADISTSFGNMGLISRDNAGVTAGKYLEDIGKRLQLPETKQAIDNWVTAVDKEPTYFGKIAAGVKGAIQNPLVLTEVAKEVGQEILPGAIGLKIAKYAGLGAGVASSTFLNAVESAGSTGRQVYDEEIAKGTPPAEAAKIADRKAGYAGIITMATSGIVDASIAKKYGAAIEDFLGKKTSSASGEFFQEGLEEGLIALATGKTPAEALTQSVVGSLVGTKTAGTIQTAADVQSDLASAFASQGLKSTDGSYKADTIVPIDSKAETVSDVGAPVVDTEGVTSAADISNSVATQIGSGANPEVVVDSAITSAINSGASVDATIGSAITSAVNAGADVNTVIQAATNAAFSTGNNVSIVSNANVVTINNATTNTNTTVDTKTGVTTTVDGNTNTTTVVDGNTTTTVDANTNTTTQTKVDGNTQTTVTADTNTNTNTQTTVDTNTNTTTSTTVNTNTNTTTQTTITGDTQTTVLTDTNTNTQTTVKVNVNTGEVIESSETEIPADWKPPEIKPPVVPEVIPPTVVAEDEASKALKLSLPRKGGATGGGGAGLPSTIDIGGEALRSRVTQGQIDPLARVKEAQAELEKEVMMNQIDPRLLSVMQQRMGIDQPNPQQQFDSDIGALAKLLRGDTEAPANESKYYSYGSEDSIDDILGGKAANYAAGGYVEPLKASGGSMALPLLAKSGGALDKYNGRENFKHGKHVAGDGDGQSDDIPAWLADGEFVIPADVVSALGNGSTKAGTDKLYEMMHSIRDRARSKGPKDLPPPALKSPLDYLKSSKRSTK